jgi:hypothetical protein
MVYSLGEMQLFTKLKDWFNKNFITNSVIVLLVLSGLTIYNLVDVVRRPPEIKDFKDGVQNHLVWSVKGECFFVKPYTDNMINLIRVQDCDKK